MLSIAPICHVLQQQKYQVRSRYPRVTADCLQFCLVDKNVSRVWIVPNFGYPSRVYGHSASCFGAMGLTHCVLRSYHMGTPLFKLLFLFGSAHIYCISRTTASTRRQGNESLSLCSFPDRNRKLRQGLNNSPLETQLFRAVTLSTNSFVSLRLWNYLPTHRSQTEGNYYLSHLIEYIWIWNRMGQDANFSEFVIHCICLLEDGR